VKWAPNLATFAPFVPRLDKSLIQNHYPPQLGLNLELEYREPVLDSHAFLPSLYLLISVSSNDLMDQNYIRAATRLRDKMASPFIAFPDFFGVPLHLCKSLEDVCHPVHTVSGGSSD
jgi:hypothetical protein